MKKHHLILIPFALAAFAVTACSTEKDPVITDTTADVIPTDTTPDAAPEDVVPQPDVALEDVAAPDVIVTDRGEGLCLGSIEVCGAECADATCFEACLTRVAASPAEEALATAYVACNVDGECFSTDEATTESARASYNCQLAKCLPERVACEQGEAGTGGCIPVGGCIAECERDDFKCYRDCLSAASAVNASTFIQLQYCVSANCYEKDGSQADFDTCLQTAIDENGPCASVRTACYGDTPGLQGIGFQPMYGSSPANPWP